MKLLKQFDPIPRYEFDDEGYKSKMRWGLRGGPGLLGLGFGVLGFWGLRPETESSEAGS